MKKARIIEDLYIRGWGTVPAGTELKVEKHNKRFVYLLLGGCSLRLARSQVKKVY